MEKKNYLVGLSGGVDSATSCALLSQDHQITPIFMQNWKEDDHCHIQEDLKICEDICKHLSLPLRTVNFEKEYFDHVFQVSLELFQKGLTLTLIFFVIVKLSLSY